MTIKINSLLCVLLFVCANQLLFAQESTEAGIVFSQEDWATLQAKAKAENKPIFVDAYAVWCRPCKWMAANTFTDPEVAAFFNAHFINAKIDMEKGEGPKLARTYRVMAYPTLLFINEDGELIYRTLGAQKAKDLIAAGKKALEKAVPGDSDENEGK
ncbi:MAG: DUF255 domain-containing protein [Bacteroidota bacterium]